MFLASQENYAILKLVASMIYVPFLKPKNMNKLNIINNTVGLFFTTDLQKTVEPDLVEVKFMAVKLCLVLTDSTEGEVAEFYNTSVDKMNARLHELELKNILSGGQLDNDYNRLKKYLSELLTTIEQRL